LATIETRKQQDGSIIYRAKQTEVSIREGRYFKTTEAKKHILAEFETRLWLPICLSLLFLLTPITVKAEADGPDYYQLRAEKSVSIHTEPQEKSATKGIIKDVNIKLKNRGCVGTPTITEWQSLSVDQQIAVKDKIWCKISYPHSNNSEVVGWVQNIYIKEYTPAQLLPHFSCMGDLHAAEEAICKNPQLVALDYKMAEVYTAALDRATLLDDQPKNAVKLLKAFQRGWIKSRNDCWKAYDGDIDKCIEQIYQRRIAVLEAEWQLVPIQKVKKFYCQDNKSNEVTATFMKSSFLPAVRIEYGDRTNIYIAVDTTDKTKYEGEFGRSFIYKDSYAIFVHDQFQPVQRCKLSP
jgi:uncharacterized protein